MQRIALIIAALFSILFVSENALHAQAAAPGSCPYFEDARQIPYPMTWDPNSAQILVETRFGAYLWHLDGTRISLTSEADGNARSFSPTVYVLKHGSGAQLRIRLPTAVTPGRITSGMSSQVN